MVVSLAPSQSTVYRSPDGLGENTNQTLQRPAGNSIAASSLESPRTKIRTPSTASISWLKPIIARFNRIMALRANWDGHGAEKVSDPVAREALTVLAQIMTPGTPMPSIVPTTDGGVQLEWHYRGVDLEIEFSHAGRIYAYFLDDEDDDEWEADASADLRQIQMALSLMRRRR